jgi:hypothetical protein
MAPDQPTLTLDFITALPNLVDGVLPALLTSIGSDGKNQRAGFIESCWTGALHNCIHQPGITL